MLSLIKELTERCRLRGSLEDDALGDSEIDQMFILTHNVHFHRDITMGRESRKYFNTTSFYLVRKENNKSNIITCTRAANETGQIENYNPVKNSYYALWHEYNELSSAVSIINVMYQILEYYFIQLCGYDGETLSDIILKKHPEKFFKTFPGTDTFDTSEYNLAEALIHRITSSPSVIAEGHFIEDENDIELYRDIFERIFKAMDQEQHYNMIMESSHWK